MQKTTPKLIDHDLNNKIAQMIGVNPEEALNWAGDIHHAWKLMEEMNAIGSPVDWQLFRKNLYNKFGLPIGYSEESACYSICHAMLASQRNK